MAGLTTAYNYWVEQGIENTIRLWTGKSAQNFGSGSVWAGLGGLNDVDFTIANSIPWTANGLDYSVASSHYAYADMGLEAWDEMWVFARISPDNASAADTNTNNGPWAFGDWRSTGSGSGAIQIANTTAALTGETQALLPQDQGTNDGNVWRATSDTNPRLGTTSLTWSATEDHMHVLRLHSGGTTLWKDKVSTSLNLPRGVTDSDDITPSGLGATDGRFVVGGAYINGAYASRFSGIYTAIAICNGPLTTAQWQQINDHIAAL